MNSLPRSPATGRFIARDGTLHNIVEVIEALSGKIATPVSSATYNVNLYAPRLGVFVGENGKAYDLLELFSLLSNQTPGGSTPDDSLIERLEALEARLDTVSADLESRPEQSELEAISTRLDAVSEGLEGKATLSASGAVGWDSNNLKIESGTWTPTMTPWGLTGDVVATGTWVKVAKLVFLSFRYEIKSVTVPGGSVLGGLPFSGGVNYKNIGIAISDVSGGLSTITKGRVHTDNINLMDANSNVINVSTPSMIAGSFIISI